jgi:hypothetical protein
MWPSLTDVVPVVHKNSTSMTLHFKTLMDLMDKPGVSDYAKKLIFIEMSETLLLNAHIGYSASFVQSIIYQLEHANDILSFDRRSYINRLNMLL